MSKVKKIQFFNKSPIFNIEIDEYSEKVSGRLYHDSIEGELHFSCFLDVSIIIEEILDYLKKPMRVFDVRTFKAKKHQDIEHVPILEKNYKKGKLLSIKLRIDCRNNVTWQGAIQIENTCECFEFDSFMEIVSILENRLIHKRTIDPIRSVMKVSNVFDILNYIKDFYEVSEVLKLSDTFRIIKLRMVTYLVDDKSTSDFYIQILYLEHNSCQGSIYWKEEREKINFRSFLELIMLMDITIRKKKIIFNNFGEEKQYHLK